MVRRLTRVWLFGLLVLPALGCGGRYAQVSGSVLKDGQTLSPDGEWVEVVFLCEEPSIRFSASVRKDGTFVAYGPNGDGIPAGKYRVGVVSDVDGKRRKQVKDFPPESSPLELDLSDGGRLSITVDVAKRTLTTG